MYKFTAILLYISSIMTSICLAQDMTVEKLLELQNRAIDQNGIYRKAKTFMTRQKLTVDGESSMQGNVIQYFKVPNKSKSLMFLNGKLNYTRIFDGRKGWDIMADGSVKELSGKALELQKILTAMNNPNKNMLKIFQTINLEKTKWQDKQYYKMTCIPKSKELDPIVIYIDIEDYLPKRMDINVWSGGKKYQSTTINKKYAVVNGIRLVEIFLVEVMNTKQNYILEDFKLDLPMTDSDFEPAFPFAGKK